MTYLTFLFIFIVPPIVVLAWLQPRPLAGVPDRGVYALPLTCLLALLYTTPWDNYLIYRGVWMYGTDRVIGTIGYVPIEEYLFFLMQPILTGLFLYKILSSALVKIGVQQLKVNVVGALPFAAAALWGGWLLSSGGDHGTYMGLILAWACPVLAGMWLYAGTLYRDLRHVYVLAVGLPTLYLWIVDRLALGMGIWHISEALSFPMKPLGLPVEEAMFFFVTNILVVQGTLLFLYGDRIRWHAAQPASG